MRRDAGFDVTDRIHVTYDTNDKLAAALQAWEDMVSGVVLALSFERTNAPEGAYTQAWDINGEQAVLSVKKA
jgi:isoleucyl-tRNA synthetase